MDTRWVECFFSIFVGGLIGRTDTDRICEVFARFGRVVNVHIRRGEGRLRALLLFGSFTLRCRGALTVNGKRVFMAMVEYRSEWRTTNR